MPSLFDFSNQVANADIDNRDSLSVARNPRFPTRGMQEDQVQSGEQYRPDKVADRLLGDAQLSWVIDDANNFFSPENYTVGTKILYPSEKALKTMGIS